MGVKKELEQLRKDLNHDLGLLYKRQERLKEKYDKLEIAVHSVISISESIEKIEGDVGYA